MKKLTAIFTLLIFLAITFNSCKNENSTNNKVDDINISDEINHLVYPVPTPFEATKMLEKSGAAYIVDLTNSTENADKYFTEKSKALNLGVYGADLSYTSTYNKAQDTRKFLIVSKKITEDLGLTSMFDDALLDRLEQNIENKDSLYKIVSDSYYDTFNKLNDNQKGTVAVMILAGGWIESLYLVSQLASLSENKSDIIKNLAQQRITSSTLLPLLQNYKDNADVAEIIVEIQKIKAIFDKLQIVDDEFVMNDAQFLELSKTIAEIRTKIVQIS